MQKQQRKAAAKQQAKKTTPVHTKKASPQRKAVRRITTRATSSTATITAPTPTLALPTQTRAFTTATTAPLTRNAKTTTTAFQSFTTPFFTTNNAFTTMAKTPQQLQFVQPLTTTAVRTAMTFKKVGAVDRKVITHEDVAKEKEQRAAEAASATATKAKKIPTLNDLMRQLYKKIHPDLMMDYPEQKEQNEKSLGTFQNFIGQLKNVDGNEKYPVIRNASLPFFLRTATPGHFQRVELFLHTDAAFNKKVIEKQLCGFFKSIGLSSSFKWDDEYFPFKGKPDFKKENEEGGEEGGAEDSGSSQGGNETYEQFMERIKKQGEKQAQQQSQ